MLSKVPVKTSTDKLDYILRTLCFSDPFFPLWKEFFSEDKF